MIIRTPPAPRDPQPWTLVPGGFLFGSDIPYFQFHSDGAISNCHSPTSSDITAIISPLAMCGRISMAAALNGLSLCIPRRRRIRRIAGGPDREPPPLNPPIMLADRLFFLRYFSNEPHPFQCHDFGAILSKTDSMRQSSQGPNPRPQDSVQVMQMLCFNATFMIPGKYAPVFLSILKCRSALTKSFRV